MRLLKGLSTHVTAVLAGAAGNAHGIYAESNVAGEPVKCSASRPVLGKSNASKGDAIFYFLQAAH